MLHKPAHIWHGTGSILMSKSHAYTQTHTDTQTQTRIHTDTQTHRHTDRHTRTHTPMVQVAGGQPKVVDLLLRQNADITLRNSSGETVLHVGARAKDGSEYFQTSSDEARAVMDQLLSTTDVTLLTAADNQGQTALHHAAIEGNVLTARMLVSAGLQWTDEDRHHRTPMMLAKSRRREEFIAAFEIKHLEAA
eukprot:TRINITY_DN9744_c0_g2_i3.p2 TRINITY_DN9744_c0_g2~~TRINITY_DN9744_c0_g2_i3.p2  ORF type:complete len:192 (+),score=18.20 TRINITY_DN9744_c0_g2_i3:772-1347(+)